MPNTFGRNERLRTINNVIANQRLAGLEPDTRTVELLYRVAAGELQIDCVIQDVRQRIASGEFCSKSAT
ncbi:antitoxin VbhA family protein [Achromobacter ruhlandii]|uniref:antitoxin VbhA family protein n=1 Tax=Achromobacter ruhlandii TaxID=72557 RepID=UPI00387E21E3